MKRFMISLSIVLIGFTLSACGALLPAEPTVTSTTTVTPSPTATITPSPTATATMTPSPTPTPLGGGSAALLRTGIVQASFKLANGNTIQTTGKQLFNLDMTTGESVPLIDVDMLTEKLGKTVVRADFQPAPDGSWILVTASTEISMETFDTADYYLVKSDLTEWIPILDINAKTIQWNWSPNSEMLVGNALTANVSLDVYVVNKDGTDMRKINTKNASSPQWSKDSTGIFWIENKKPVYYNLASGKSTPIDPNVHSENLADGDKKLTSLFVSPYADLLVYITDGVAIVANTDFSNGRVIIGSSDTTCAGKYPASVVFWSTDGQYLVMKSYSCVKAFGTLIPKAKHRLIDVDDTFTSVMRPETACGWSTDGYFTLIDNVDGESQLIFMDLKANETVYKLPWKSGCPIWLH